MSLIVFSLIERTRYAILQTLLNPIASDSFGIDEKSASFVFLSLFVPQLAGAVILYVIITVI